EAYLALVAEPHDIARRKPLRRLDESAPARPVETLVQRRFDRRLGTAPDAPAAEPRWYYLAVIDDQGIARAQQVREVAHRPIVELRCRAGPNDQQPRRIARRNRPQRDSLRRQLEIKQIGKHAPS